MEFQFYWRGWWKIWPHYSRTTDWWGPLIGYVETTWFCIGPFQMIMVLKDYQMTEYLPYKKKSFKLQKEATAWIKAEKKAYGGTKPVKIETNYIPGNPFPWEGVVLLKDENGQT